MKILFILQYVPFPLNSGGNQAMYNMIDEIRKVHEVSIAIQLNNEVELAAFEQLQKKWPNVSFNYVMRNQASAETCEQELYPTSFVYRMLDKARCSLERKQRRRIRKFREGLLLKTNEQKEVKRDFVRSKSTLFFPWPEVEYSERWREMVYNLSREGFDVIQTEFYECLPMVHLLPRNVKRVFVHHEIRFIRNQNEIKYFADEQKNDKMLFDYLKSKEMSLLAMYDKIVVLTEKDRDILLAENPNLDIYVSPAAVVQPAQLLPFVPCKSDLVFVGSGDHFPNADGVVWFVRECLPLLHARGYYPRLRVVGVWREALRKELDIHSKDVEFVGFVEDLQTYMNGKISIVPIRIGSGMRMKILDSIYANSPMVTTSKGCEGLPLRDGVDCVIADSATEFCDGIIRLMSNPKEQSLMAEHAVNSFTQNYNTKIMQDRRLDLYNLLAK